MWSFTTSLLSKFVGLGPMQTFLKYIFKRISKDFLQSEPNIDIKNGLLELGDMPLSSTKINKTVLSSSPYSMHRGLIKNVRILIPNLSELSQKSIQVEIRGIELDLTPNKMFQKKFMEHLAELKQNSAYLRQNSKFDPQPQPQKSLPEDTTSVDFFKQFFGQIIKNIKVKIHNITIRLFMNSAYSQNPSDYHCQLNIPLLNFERFRDREIGKTNEEFEKYRLTMEHFRVSLPLTKEPLDCHSILLIGKHDMAKSNKSEVIFKIARNQKEKTKQTTISVNITNIELMIQPYQLKIILQFFKQIQDFKNLYKDVTNRFKKIQDLPLDESRDFEIHDIPEPKLLPSRSSLQSSMDFFMSVVMNMDDKPDDIKKSRRSYFDEILLENNNDMKMLKEEVKAIQKQIPSGMQQQLKHEETIAYASTVNIRVQIDMFCLYFLKRTLNCRRQWTKATEIGYQPINQRILCSYFLARLQNISVEVMKELINIKVSMVRVLDVTSESKHICANTLLVISSSKPNERIYSRIQMKDQEPLTINIRKTKKESKITISAYSLLVDLDISVICFFSQFIEKKQNIRQDNRSLNYSTYQITHLSKRQHSEKSELKSTIIINAHLVNVFLSNHKKQCYCSVNDYALALQLRSLSMIITKRTLQLKIAEATLSMFNATANKLTLLSQVLKIKSENKPILIFQKIKSGFKNKHVISTIFNKIEVNFISSQQFNKYLEFSYGCLIDLKNRIHKPETMPQDKKDKTPVFLTLICQHINIYYGQYGLFTLNFELKIEELRMQFRVKEIMLANISQFQTKIISFQKNQSEEVYDPTGYNTDRFSIPYQIGSDKIILQQKMDDKCNILQIDRKVKMIEERVTTPEREAFCFTKPKKCQFYKTEEMVVSLTLLETRFILTELHSLLKEVKKILQVKKNEQRLRKMMSDSNKKEEKIMKFTLAAPILIIDTWPYFRSGILHNTRNITLLEHIVLSMTKQENKEFTTKTEKLQMELDISSIKCFFLAFQDSSIVKNPFIMSIEFLQDYGFKSIIHLKKLKLAINNKDTKDANQQSNIPTKSTILDITLDGLHIGCSAITTIHLQEHIKYVIKKQHQAVEINDNQSQSSAEDLDQFCHKMQQKQEMFEKQNILFKKQPHFVNPSLPLINNFKIHIKKFTINIYSGDDYSFIDTADSREGFDYELQIDDNCEVVRKELVPDVKSFKVRFRNAEPNVFTALIIDISTINFEMKEYHQKAAKPKQIFLKLSQCSILLDIIHQERFTLLKFKNMVSLSVCSDQALWIRCDQLPKITCGFHSGINFLKNERKNYLKILENSAFFVAKPKVANITQTPTSIVLFIPQFTACIDVRLIGIQILNCQQLTVSQLLIPRSVYNISFDEYVKRWLKNIITSNLGNVLGNAFLSLLYEGLIFTFSLVKQVVVLPGQLVRNFLI